MASVEDIAKEFGGSVVEETAKEDTIKDVATIDEQWAAFEKAQEDAKATSSRPTIDGLRLNGNTGIFSRSHFDLGTKEVTYTDLAEKTIRAVVLDVKFLAKWKYKKDAQYTVVTREFADFRKDPIELIKRENAAGAESTSTFFDNYGAFKEAKMMTDSETGEVRSPFDLWVSLYLLVDGEVLRLRFKGDSRSKWFDYSNTVRVTTSVVTEIGVSDPIEMPARDGEEAKVYYHLTFKNAGAVPPEERGQVMTAWGDLKMWMESFKKGHATDSAKVAAEEVKALPGSKNDEEPPF